MATLGRTLIGNRQVERAAIEKVSETNVPKTSSEKNNNTS